MAYKPVTNYPLHDGTTTTYDVSVLDANYLYLSQKLPSVKDYGAVGDGVTDDTSAIQAAVSANANGVLIVPPGNYVITSAINILTRITLIGFGGRMSNILLATQNQNGIVVGDGTLSGRANSSNTTIKGIGFYAKPGLSACSSGSFIFANYASWLEIDDCIFDGRDSGGPSKVFTGVTAFQLQEYSIRRSLFIGLLGRGHETSSTLPANLCTDGRIDNCEFQRVTQECIYFGSTTGGMVVTKPIMFNNSSWAIKIDSAAGASNNVNFFIDTPDIECDGTGQGIYCKQGVNIQINGGWIGVNTATGPIGLQVDSTASPGKVANVDFNTANVVVSGTSWAFSNCAIAGNGSTTSYAVTVNATATDTVITGGYIRQSTVAGIHFVGSPPRCVVTGVSFRNNALNANGDVFPSTGAPPVFINCYDDATNFTITAAASLPLRHGMRWIFVTGATHITSMIGIGFGSEITMLADAGGVNIDNTVNIVLKGSVNVTVPAGAQIGFQFDGSKWRETWRSF